LEDLSKEEFSPKSRTFTEIKEDLACRRHTKTRSYQEKTDESIKIYHIFQLHCD